jgi:N-formylglutamate amidohydrolase
LFGRGIHIAESWPLSDTYSFSRGCTPLLVSVPHDGRRLPREVAAEMTAAGRSIPDTDWHVARLYDFVAELGASVISAEYSRYVVDLNRSADDASLYDGCYSTGLCPTRTFAGDDIYRRETSIDTLARVSRYWRPYHQKIDQTLQELRSTFGCALLWDAHSIPSRVPLLFDGELPELNIGSWQQRSCAADIAAAVKSVADASPYGAVLDGRFTGGYITRHYGRPADGVHAIQLELAQRSYMNERTGEYDETTAAAVRATLAEMLRAFMNTAPG